MAQRDRDREIYVEREGASAVKWFIAGGLLGAGLALLFAPQSGGETRRGIRRRLRKLRAMTEEKLDDLSDSLGRGGERVRELLDDAGDELEEWEGRARSARDDLERRVAEVRARRRGPAPAPEDEDEEEPVA